MAKESKSANEISPEQINQWIKEQKRIKKAIERNELPQTQDIDVQKLVEVYERDQDVRFPVKGRARTKEVDNIDKL